MLSPTPRNNFAAVVAHTYKEAVPSWGGFFISRGKMKICPDCSADDFCSFCACLWIANAVASLSVLYVVCVLSAWLAHGAPVVK